MDDHDNGCRVTAHCRGGDEFVHFSHNRRDQDVTQAEEHIIPNGYHRTIIDMGDDRKAFEIIFDEALKEYNKGKRPCRQIKNYFDTVANDARLGKHKNPNADGSRKTCYEFIFQIGNRDDHPDNALCEKILTDFVTKYIPEHYPNIRPIQITVHGDEFSLDEKGNKIMSPFHIHFDFVYVAHTLSKIESELEKKRREERKKELQAQTKAEGEKWDEKKWQNRDWQPELVHIYGKSLMSGLPLQCSMTAALAEMGFFTCKGKGTAQTQFEEQVRHDLEDFAEQFGVKIDRTKGPEHDHMSKEVYQQMKENEKKSAELSQREISIAETESKLKSEKKNFAMRENDIKEKEELLAAKEKFYDAYSTYDPTEDEKFIELGKCEEELLDTKNDAPIESRIKNFVSKCKEILSDVMNTIKRYRDAIPNLWKAKPESFRNLADDMDRNFCATFAEYDTKRRAGKLKSQMQATDEIKFRHNTRKVKIIVKDDFGL